MAGNIVAGLVAIPLAAFFLATCVSQSAYNEQASQLEQAQAQVAAQQAQIAKMQAENRWVMAGDLLFPDGGYELSAAGQAALSQYAPQLRSMQNVKIVVYGFTDNAPVGPALQRAGIADNLDLSSRRAATVAAFLQSEGVNPSILSAKGFGATHPIAPNDTPQGRAQNRRIEIVLEGPGA
ncbi:MAG: OmpA family protein [Acetobacteraceae bacterium]|nr:OmpA family protein [Acetobacteraceae bacterium]